MSTIGVSNRQEAEEFLYGLSSGHIVELLLNAMNDETLVRVVNCMIEQLAEHKEQ